MPPARNPLNLEGASMDAVLSIETYNIYKISYGVSIWEHMDSYMMINLLKGFYILIQHESSGWSADRCRMWLSVSTLQDGQCTKVWLVFHVLHGESGHGLWYFTAAWSLTFVSLCLTLLEFAASHCFLHICGYCSSYCLPRAVIDVSSIDFSFWV